MVVKLGTLLRFLLKHVNLLMYAHLKLVPVKLEVCLEVAFWLEQQMWGRKYVLLWGAAVAVGESDGSGIKSYCSSSLSFAFILVVFFF